MQRGEEKCARSVDGRCPDQGDSRFSFSREKKDFKIESKDRNSPSGKPEDVDVNLFAYHLLNEYLFIQKIAEKSFYHSQIPFYLTVIKSYQNTHLITACCL